MTMPTKPLAPNQSIGVGERDDADLGQEEIHRTEAGEDVLDAERTDKRRQDQRRKQRGPQPFARGKLVAGEEDGEWNRNESREEGGKQRDLEAVTRRRGDRAGCR